MPAQVQERKILIKVDTSDARGIRDTAEKLGLINRHAKSLAGDMRALTSTFQAWIAFLGVRQLVTLADTMQNFSNRLKITAQAGEDTAQTMLKIANLADRTKQSITATGEVYNRLAISLSKVNPRSDELIALTETLTNTFRIAGSTASETSNTIVQLSQAFTSGELRGQELRSVMEQNGVLARILNDEFGKLGNVYKAAEKGQIRVADVLRLLADQQDRIQKQADILAPTFEQTLTKAMNKLTIGIGQLNDQFKLSEKFAWAMSFAIDNLGNALAIATPILIAWASTYVPALILAFRRLAAAGLAATLSNPITAGLAAVAVVAVLVYQNMNKITIAIKKTQAAYYDLFALAEEGLAKWRAKLTSKDDPVAMEGAKRASELRAKAEQLKSEARSIEAISRQYGPEKTSGDDLRSLADRVGANDKGNQKLRKLKEILGDINKELQGGAISVGEYNSKLVNFEIVKLNREFREGKFDVFTYNQRLNELNLQELNRQLKLGVISLSAFQEQARQNSLDELSAKFEAGKIGLIEYNQELVKISEKFLPGSALIAGTSSYIESIGTLSDNIAKGISQTFSHLEDNLVEFIKTGTFNFAKFTQAVLDDLTRIIVRASIMKPLAEAILGGAASVASSGGGGSAGGSATNVSGFAAKGMAFSGGVRKFASGGIVDSPTMFRYGGSKTGMMGEAGTEAIVPLRRAGNGDLGVAASLTPVTINIINQSGSQVEQKETTGPGGEKTIDILIFQKVREGITTGKFDAPMKQTYGLSRKGS